MIAHNIHRSIYFLRLKTTLAMDIIKILITIITLAGGVGGVITLAKDIYGIRTKVLRLPWVRRMVWFLTNKKISVRISVTKVYSVQFEPKTHEVFNKVKDKIVKRFGKFMSQPIIGQNYFQFVAEGMSAPIIFRFHPDIDDDEVVGTVVQSEVLGNLVFVYREAKKYEETLKLIEDIYHVIEEVHGLHRPDYVNYTVKATISETFEEDWSTKKEIKQEDSRILVGSKIVLANSRTLVPLLDLKKYILMVG